MMSSGEYSKSDGNHGISESVNIRRNRSSISLDMNMVIGSHHSDIAVPSNNQEEEEHINTHRQSTRYTPTSPSAVLSGGEDDSLSISQNDFVNSGCTSGEEVTDGVLGVSSDVL